MDGCFLLTLLYIFIVLAVHTLESIKLLVVSDVLSKVDTAKLSLIQNTVDQHSCIVVKDDLIVEGHLCFDSFSSHHLASRQMLKQLGAEFGNELRPLMIYL